MSERSSISSTSKFNPGNTEIINIVPTKKIAVVIPTYRSRDKVCDVVNRVEDCVDSIYVVDDGCPQNSGAYVRETLSDPRLHVVFMPKNTGVGGATLFGMKRALEDGCDIAVKVDSDGQIDPRLVTKVAEPIVKSGYDYVKGNRFIILDNIGDMPFYRIVLNSILSFTNKFASGYYSISDPTNGLIAISSSTLKRLPTDKIKKRFFFESDLLFYLNLDRARIKEIPVKAIYNNEESNLRIRDEAFSFLIGNIKNFFKRVFLRHFLINFHLPAIYLVVGILMTCYGSIIGGFGLITNIGSPNPASPGTVVIPAMFIILGINFLTQFLLFDVNDEPR